MKTNSRNLILFILAFLCAGSFSYAQNDFFFSHYMLNTSYFNPGSVGVENNAFAALHHRSQWAGYEPTSGAGSPPSTQLFTLVVPTKKILSGIGVSLVNDKLPTLRNNQVRLALSKRINFRSSSIAIGVAPAVNIQTLDPNDFDPVDAEQFGTLETRIAPNLHAGIFYRNYRDLFVGVSVENIMEPTFSFAEFENAGFYPLNYLLLAGKDLRMTRQLRITPSVLVRSDLLSYTFDISAIATYEDKMWGGLGFRRSESIGLMLGYSFFENKKLRAGYSLDYVIVDQESKQPTSHEIFVKYELPGLIFGGRKAVKTPRFTF